MNRIDGHEELDALDTGKQSVEYKENKQIFLWSPADNDDCLEKRTMGKDFSSDRTNCQCGILIITIVEIVLIQPARQLMRLFRHPADRISPGRALFIVVRCTSENVTIASASFLLLAAHLIPKHEWGQLNCPNDRKWCLAPSSDPPYRHGYYEATIALI